MDLDYRANQMTAWPIPVSWGESVWPQNRTSAAEKSCKKSNDEESSVGASITNDVTAHLGQYTYTSLQLIIHRKSFCITRVFDLPLQHALTYRNTKHFCCARTKSNTPERGRESQNILLASGGWDGLEVGGGVFSLQSSALSWDPNRIGTETIANISRTSSTSKVPF